MGKARELSERLEQNRFITRPVMRRAERSPDGVINESAAGRRDFRHNIERRADHERGNSLRFDDV